MRRGEKKKDRKQWKGTKGIVGRPRKVKCLDPSFRKNEQALVGVFS